MNFVSKESADYFNSLQRELQVDPKALEKRFEADMRRVFGTLMPQTPEPETAK